MSHIPTTKTKLDHIRRAAKDIAAAPQHISHTAALDRAAREAGYNHWKHALECGRATMQAADRNHTTATMLLAAMKKSADDQLAGSGSTFFVEFSLRTMTPLLGAMLALDQPITAETIMNRLADRGRALLDDPRLPDAHREGLDVLQAHDHAHFMKMMASFVPFMFQQLRTIEATIATAPPQGSKKAARTRAKAAAGAAAPTRNRSAKASRKRGAAGAVRSSQ